ncbi:DNA polymerase III subunit beta [Hymenobacter sp. YC55]|uniref:DNA polymerase III subunit beta n=1 Tax=Hymenobacter sp. YC55 TaxID=3034019 RepID=UPI0023F91A97|nr:DNA polymerase III subunit beta [Hymenobacter sp. YC55]MDF7810732.1 DNA polymerase III subunit beta [Hymenobacter sp. YC55]
MSSSISKFTVSATAFARAVAQVTPVVPSSPLVSILETVVLVGTGSVVGAAASLKLVCSNLETQLLVSLPVDCFSNFMVCIPAKTLLATLKGFPDAPVTCEVDETNNILTLLLGRSRYKMVGEAVKDFPRMSPLAKVFTTITMPEQMLRAALVATLSTASTNDSRPALNAVMFEARNHDAENAPLRLRNSPQSLSLVGISNNRLCLWQADAQDERYEEVTWDKPTKFLVPRQAIQLLISQLNPKSADPIVLHIDETNIRTSSGSWVSRLLAETPMEYRQVIPGLGGQVAEVDRDEMLTALRRLAIYTPDKTDMVVLNFNNARELQLSADNHLVGNEGNETVSCAYDGNDMMLAFPSGHLVQLLSIWDKGRVLFHLGGTKKPTVITLAEEGDVPTITCTIMPSYLPEAIAA